MRRVTQTLSDILGSLQPLRVEWQDEVARRVIERLRAFPVKESYAEDDIRDIIENGKTATLLDGQDLRMAC